MLPVHVVRYWRERWPAPNVMTLTVALPLGVNSHFSAELRRFVLAQHHQEQVTVRRVAVRLREIGIDTSRDR